jgi:poly-gamma-glutamate synthase PgsB/CapB
METQDRLRDIATLGLTPTEKKVYADSLAELLAAVDGRRRPWISRRNAKTTEEIGSKCLRLIQELRQRITSCQDTVVQLRRREAEFNIAFAKAGTEEERRQFILAFAADLGASKSDLDQDRRAFARWFGEDAIKDRFIRRLNAKERLLAFSLGRLGEVGAYVLRESKDPEQQVHLWERLDIESITQPLLAYEGDVRVVTAALEAITRTVDTMPIESREGRLEEGTLQYVYRSALQVRQDVWVQTAAIRLLRSVSQESALRVLRQRLSKTAPGDDFFVRRRAVEVLIELGPFVPGFDELLECVFADPSPFVRQGLLESMYRLPFSYQRDVLERAAIRDSHARVRACAVVELADAAIRPDAALHETCRATLVMVLTRETDSLVLRASLRAAVTVARRLRERRHPGLTAWCATFYRRAEELRFRSSDVSMRRWAAQAREAIWCAGDDVAHEILVRFKAATKTLRNGRRTTLPARYYSNLPRETLGRALSVCAQDDFGFDVSPGRWRFVITRGHDFRFRWWRFIHEFRHPSPDKRQAFRHTIGRAFYGSIRVPSAIVSELAETKVPGEPLFISDENGWRPFLPLVDEMLSVADQWIRARPVEIFTSEGITEIRPPTKLLSRLRAHWNLTWNFAKQAKLRNWKKSGAGSPKKYIEELRKLGFSIELRPYAPDSFGAPETEPEAAKFFGSGLPAFGPELFDQFRSYLFSVYENTLFELAAFASLMTVAFCGRHLHSNYTLRKARRSIPLVIGGWGTRGKSGTERIKAGLIAALGHGYVSKTTGCEAMFLYAHPFGRTKEMFLFRPYDKATIWEQRNVVRFAEASGSHVFLWECMGLTPDYVRILQKHWMKDDLSTITNTYPDHEDIQGPAGINIPQVMCEFIPNGGRLFTTEEQMLPIVREGAEALDTKMTSAGWLEAGLLTEDVLARFPYDEHPFNIALVLELARELRVPKDFALKAMADRVVADLGVLKTSPTSLLRDRWLEFANGMSANERHGSVGNWTRLGFDKEDPVEKANVWLVTVVNNRADRVARSRVFADVIVRDLAADRHILIGSNLLGLQGYIKEAWQAYAATISLTERNEDGSLRDPIEVCNTLLYRHRMPVEKQHILRRILAMLAGLKSAMGVEEVTALIEDSKQLAERLTGEGLGRAAPEICAWLDDMKILLADFDGLREKIRRAGGGNPQLDEDFKALLWKWYWWKIVVVQDFYATGDAVIDTICRSIPPGLFCRVMGVQNIKGTGLDFVYRWQAWEKCHRAASLLRSSDGRAVEEGVRELMSFKEYGLLCEEYVRESIDIVRRSPFAQREVIQSALSVIETNLASTMEVVRSKIGGGNDKKKSKASAWFEKTCAIVEQFLDTGDAVRRRKMANKVYKDLIAERISIDRAAAELLEPTKRQKGGWLLKQLKAAHAALLRNRVFTPWRK